MRVPDRRSWRPRSERLADAFRPRRHMLELAAVACLRVDLYTTLDRSDRAVEVCLDYLRQRRHRVVAASDGRGGPAANTTRSGRSSETARSRHSSTLPSMTDPASLATLDVLTKARRRRPVHRCQPAFPGHLQSGQSQPGARQQRRFVCRLRHGSARSPDRASATTRRRIASASSATNWSTDADWTLPGPRPICSSASASCPGRNMSGRAADLLRRAFETAQQDRRSHLCGHTAATT